MEEGVRIVFFLGSVCAVYALVVVSTLRRWGKRGIIPWKAWEKAAWVLGLVGIGCILYGHFVEPYWLQVRHVTLPTSKWDAREPPLRVVLFSDMHSDATLRLEKRLPEVIAAEHPDLILFAGDSVNSPAGLNNFRMCMTAIAHIAPTYAVKGNWDAFIWPGLSLFEGTGVHELGAEGVNVLIKGKEINIIGAAADRQSEIPHAFASVPVDRFTLFIHHYPYPDVLSETERGRTDLFVAGHVHGGQVALPFYGAIITFSRFGKHLESGLYHVGGMPLYVTRGIGMEGGPAPRVRFFARPELTVIDFVGSKRRPKIEKGLT